MKNFRWIDDIVEWLEPLDYQSFWYAVAPYDLTLQPFDHCERQIAEGAVDRDTVLDVLKSMARHELTGRHGLHWKPATPWLKVVD